MNKFNFRIIIEYKVVKYFLNNSVIFKLTVKKKSIIITEKKHSV